MTIKERGAKKTCKLDKVFAVCNGLFMTWTSSINIDKTPSNLILNVAVCTDSKTNQTCVWTRADLLR